MKYVHLKVIGALLVLVVVPAAKLHAQDNAVRGLRHVIANAPDSRSADKNNAAASRSITVRKSERADNQENRDSPQTDLIWEKYKALASGTQAQNVKSPPEANPKSQPNDVQDTSQNDAQPEAQSPGGMTAILQSYQKRKNASGGMRHMKAPDVDYEDLMQERKGSDPHPGRAE